MHNLYARFVLWLIRPALELHAERGGPTLGEIWKRVDASLGASISRNTAIQKRFFESSIGQTDSPAWRTSSPNDDRRQK